MIPLTLHVRPIGSLFYNVLHFLYVVSEELTNRFMIQRGTVPLRGVTPVLRWSLPWR